MEQDRILKYWKRLENAILLMELIQPNNPSIQHEWNVCSGDACPIRSGQYCIGCNPGK
jgi:hypothetical protein